MEGGNSHEIDRQELVDPWSSFEESAKEIAQNRQPVNWQKMVGDNRVALLGEEHGNSLIRNHLAAHAKDLKTAGITHYAIEAEATEKSKDALAKLQSREPVDLSGIELGPFMSDEGRSNYEQAVRAMATQGIQIVPIDIDQTQQYTIEEREAHMMGEVQKLLESDPSAKVAVLVGDIHTNKTTSQEGVPFLGKRITDAGIPAVTIQFAGGKSPALQSLLEGAKRAGSADQEFMLDMRPYAKSKHVPFGAGQTDFVVHLPQQKSPPGLSTSNNPSLMDFGTPQYTLIR